MLLDIRETIRNSKPLKYTLITVISIPFALVGIGSYFSGGQAAGVAEVDGVEISQQQLDQAYNQQRQRLAQMFGGEIPEGFANDELLRQQALQQLIEQQVVRSEVERENFAVGDATLGREIRNLPIFQADGKFDDETYRAQIRAMGSSVAGFEQQFRDDTAITQFRNGIAQTSFRLPSEQQRIDELSRQTRSIDTLRFDIEKTKKGITLADGAAKEWFDERADQYQFPERAKLAWLELDRSKLADAIEVTDDEARAYYDENRGRYMKPPVRRASHILITLEDDASDDAVEAARATLVDLRTQVEEGADFAALAKSKSEDVGSADGGGSLGAITPGSMVPEFESALEELNEEGALSEPVRSEFGMHLIRLDGIKPESGQSFAKVKGKIRKTMQTDRADQEFGELRELLSELTFDNPESLEVAAEETGLEVQESDWVDAQSQGDTLAYNPQVLSTAFSEEVKEEGNNSDIIELSDGQAVVVRVMEHEGPRPQTLEDVRPQIVDAIKAERAGKELDKAMKEARGKLVSGDSVADLAKGNKLAKSARGTVLTREATTFSRDVIDQVFALPRPSDQGKPVVGSSTLAAGDRLLYRLTKVEVPPKSDAGSEEGGDSTAREVAEGADPDSARGADRAAAADGTEVEGSATGSTGVAAPDLGNIEFGALVSNLRERTDIETY